MPGLPVCAGRPKAAIKKGVKAGLVMDIEWFNKNIKCCACGGTLETSELNVFVTEKLATWKHPVFGCFDIPDYGPRAMALICDECLRNKEKVQHCIEWEETQYQIRYHDIESLKDRNKSKSQKKYYFGRMFRPGRKVEIELMYPKNTAATLLTIKRSKYQVLSTDQLARCRQDPPPFGKKESEKMGNPEYFRLMNNGRFAGFKRIVTEFLPPGHSAWQLDEIEHDPDATQKLRRPAVGTETLKREKINSNT